MCPRAPQLLRSKLAPPAPRAGLVPRPGPQSRLQAGLQAKLCLLSAPPGTGKTTLLTERRAAEGADRTAWVSLDEDDSDPARLWVHVVEALRTVEPDVGATALAALRRTGADLCRAVLPSLHNDLRAVGAPLVLVLDDYHLVTDATCHRTLAFFLRHLPAGIHVALSTRADPPLPLARMRATGELAEVRAPDLQFTVEEASALLNGSMGLELAPDGVEQLVERTEGWAAGLVLAGLSLRGREDPGHVVASFHGDNRHLADFLVAEVLARQPEPIRRFLLRTSVLERLSGPVCDAVLETNGSTELLTRLERSNLFLVPLDGHRRWYRYHGLFREWLRLELGRHEPALVPVLHRRAAAWYRQAGSVEDAIHHAVATRELTEAGMLITRHWLRHWRAGRQATVARWLEELPEEAITAAPPLAFVAAWIGGLSGASRQQTQRRLAAVERGDDGDTLPDGITSLDFGAALTRAALIYDDVGGAVRAARRALELAGPEPFLCSWMAQAASGHALYLSGQPARAGFQLEELVRRVSPAEQPYPVVIALAILSLIAGDEGSDRTAAAHAGRAAALAEAHGLTAEPLCGIVHMAVGRALTLQGTLVEADEQLRRALELLGIDSMLVDRVHALLLLASVRQGHGDVPGARALVEQARELVERLADPGALPRLVEQADRDLASVSRRQVEAAPALSRRERAVLGLLPTRLSNREIGQELFVSVNTVRTQVRAIYRKLEVTSRAEAVARARHLRLLPGSTPTGRQTPHPDELQAR